MLQDGQDAPVVAAAAASRTRPGEHARTLVERADPSGSVWMGPDDGELFDLGWQGREGVGAAW